MLLLEKYYDVFQFMLPWLTKCVIDPNITSDYFFSLGWLFVVLESENGKHFEIQWVFHILVMFMFNTC
jgi:hypothetical protein